MEGNNKYVPLDELEINKNLEFEVMVMLSDKDTGIELRHYRTISLEGIDCQTNVRTLRDQDDDKVPWREKLVATTLMIIFLAMLPKLAVKLWMKMLKRLF